MSYCLLQKLEHIYPNQNLVHRIRVGGSCMRVGGWKGGRTEKRGGKTVDLEKLVEFHASAFIRVSSNPCIGPLPRAKASFFYCPYELMSYCLLQKLEHIYPNQNLEMKNWIRIKSSTIFRIRRFIWISIFS